jgi:carnitine O-acetyltransferase
MAAVSKLPRQPIPPLEHTLDAAMRSVSPMLNGLQRIKSKLVFELYGASQAKQQQRLLRLAREQPINWCAAGLTHLWLSGRGGLPFSNSYVLLLEDDPRAATLTERAARLIVAALNLYQSIRAQALSQDVSANLPLEMDQYLRCFATHRRPRPHCDELVTVTGSHHIAVLIDGKAYCLAVDLQSGAVSLRAVQQVLEHIVENADAGQEVDQAPGMLSALPREQWVRQRGELLKDSRNQQTLSMLEKALFIVCLDTGVAPGSPSGFTANLRDGNSHNRYYDKSMQIVVMEDGKAGLCFERAAVDGSVALGFAARLQGESLKLLPATQDEQAGPVQGIRTRAAPWAMSLALKRQLQAANKFIAEGRNQRGIESWTTPHIGKGRLKALKISADAVVQLAIQVAVCEVTGETPATFEPVQLRHFAGGRMDFIVPVTAESLSAVQALRDPLANQYHVAVHVRRAAKEHQHLVLRTKNGRGLIAHLLALNAIQEEDASYNGTHSWHRAVLSRLDKGLQALFRQDVLAANGSDCDGVAAFGPIGPRPDMLSIGYLIREDDIGFDLRADGRFSGQTRALRTALEKALVSIARILTNCKPVEPR